MAAANKEAVKVVLIDTQYVNVDPSGFKALVQRLTGKDSCVAWIEESSFADQKEGPGLGCSGSGAGACVSVLSEGLSFKDLDKLMMELPPLQQDFHW